MVGWDGIEPPTPGFSVLRRTDPMTGSAWARHGPGPRGEDGAGVLPVPGLGTPANGVGHIARAEVRPGAAEDPGSGQDVEPRPLVAQIHEAPPGLAGGPRKRQDERSCLWGMREKMSRALIAQPAHILASRISRSGGDSTLLRSVGGRTVKVKTSPSKKKTSATCPGCGARAGRCSMNVIYVPAAWWREKPKRR